MATPLSHAALATALVTELTRSLLAVLPDAATTQADAPATGTGWQMAVNATGTFEGTVTVWIDRRGAAALAAQLLGSNGPLTDAVVVDRLRQLWVEVLGATERGSPHQGLTLQPARLELAEAPADAVRLDVAHAGAEARMAVLVRPREAATVASSPAAPGDNGQLDALLDIDLPLVVRFARTTMSIRTLAAVGPGTIVDMERSPEAPVDLVVGNRVIAHGEVVVVGGNYGVRVTKVCNPAGRVRTLEA